VLAQVAWPSFGTADLIGTVMTAVITLLVPGARLIRSPEPATALAAFNAPSFQPLCVLAFFAVGAALHKPGF
jgi:hypothetical protein